MDWNVEILKYGSKLLKLKQSKSGRRILKWIDDCPNDLFSALTYQGGKGWRNNLLEFFEMRDIDRNKIIFADREPSYEKHLSRYKVGDLLLDTFNYNGHTTTIEALWSCLLYTSPSPRDS